MIVDYLERLGRELSFDRTLARSVQQEVEDHLWEAVGADPSGDLIAAQRRRVRPPRGYDLPGIAPA